MIQSILGEGFTTCSRLTKSDMPKVTIEAELLRVVVEEFTDKQGALVQYGKYVADVEGELVQGTCSTETATLLEQYVKQTVKLVYEYRVGKDFKPKLVLVGVK